MPGQRFNRLRRSAGIEVQVAGERRISMQAVQYQIGVGHCRLCTTQSVCGRPRIGPGTPRTYRENVARITPGDAATTRPYGDDFHLRRAIGKSGNGLVGGQRRTKVIDQTNIGAGTPHVASNELPDSDSLTEIDRSGNATGRTRQHSIDRKSTRLMCTGNAAIGCHEKNGPAVPFLSEFSL